MKPKNQKAEVLFLVSIATFLFVAPQNIAAAVVINEIAWMGSKIEGVDSKNWSRYEWIELYNAGEQEIDISGWRIENGAAKNEDLVISSGKIPSQGYFLVCKTEIGGCDSINSKISLHNEYNKNGQLALRHTTGNTVDTTPGANTAAWPGGDNQTKQTMERKNLTEWQTSAEPNGTPKTKNSQATETRSLVLPESGSLATSSVAADEVAALPPTPPSTSTPTLPQTETSQSETTKSQIVEYPKNVFINEILPSPEGADADNEWIELYNANNFEVDLSGWQIRDKVGQTLSYHCPTGTRIAPLSFLLIRRPESKIILQNNGDGLELLNPNGEIIHRVDYPNAPQGKSYNRAPLDVNETNYLTGQADSDWVWSTVLTPGKENIISQPKLLKTKFLGTDEAKKEQAQPQSDPKLKEVPLAKIGEELPKISNRIITFIIAFAIALVSAIIVLFLKKKMPTKE